MDFGIFALGSILKYIPLYEYIGDYMYTTVRVAESTRQKIEALKEYKRESIDEVLNRLISSYPQVKDELVSELVKEANEFEKRPHKRFTSIEELRREIEGK